MKSEKEIMELLEELIELRQIVITRDLKSLEGEIKLLNWVLNEK